jgi:predicted ATP-dependent endonuclease of OLD family
MKILNFEINNYRSCIKTKFDLQKTLTALIGINGVGKSNILFGFQLFNKTERSRRFFYNSDKNNLLKAQVNLTIEINEKIVFVRSNFYYETDEQNIDEVTFTEIKYRFEIQNTRRWQTIDAEIYDFVDFLKRRPGANFPRQFQTETAKFSIELIQTLSNISYYSATQFSDPSKCPISIDEYDDYKSISRNRSGKTHGKFIFDLFRAYTSSEKTFKLFLNTVGMNGLKLLDNIEFNVHQIPSNSYKVRTGGQIQTTENLKNIIIPSITIDGLCLSPNQLSEGTFKTLALVFYILNDKSEVLLIEEPEVCVHHGLLNSIIELIKFQSFYKQIVISTHSDYVLDMLEPENILLIKKEKEKGTIATPLTKALSKNDFEVLKDYLQTSGNLGEYWKEGGFEND